MIGLQSQIEETISSLLHAINLTTNNPTDPTDPADPASVDAQRFAQAALSLTQAYALFSQIPEYNDNTSDPHSS